MFFNNTLETFLYFREFSLFQNVYMKNIWKRLTIDVYHNILR